MKPEEKARRRIDALLEAAGWSVQDMSQLNLAASLGVAVREFPLESGFADYLLFVDRKAVGVSVDMISTGTDIKPLECLIFMRNVKSRVYFEQMKGRGTRTILPTDLRAATPSAEYKTHFVIVDAVGVCENEWLKVEQLGDEYWLYIVTDALTAPELYLLQNPRARLDPETVVERVRYQVPTTSWRPVAERAVDYEV